MRLKTFKNKNPKCYKLMFDLHLAYFENPGLTSKQKFPVGLKNRDLLPVKLETLLWWLCHRLWNVVTLVKLSKDVSVTKMSKTETKGSILSLLIYRGVEQGRQGWEIKVREAGEKGTGSGRFPPPCPSPTDYWLAEKLIVFDWAQDTKFKNMLLIFFCCVYFQVSTTHHLCSSAQLPSSDAVHIFGHESYEVWKNW